MFFQIWFSTAGVNSMEPVGVNKLGNIMTVVVTDSSIIMLIMSDL